MVQSEGIGTLWQIYQNGILNAFGRIVIMQLLPKPSNLHSDGRIHLRIEVRRAPEDLGCDLILLGMGSRMIDCVSR